MINILLNAKDAIKNNNIENGEIFISVKKNKSSVEILIEDNGGGIDDKEILKSIFDLYFTRLELGNFTEFVPCFAGFLFTLEPFKQKHSEPKRA